MQTGWIESDTGRRAGEFVGGGSVIRKYQLSEEEYEEEKVKYLMPGEEGGVDGGKEIGSGNEGGGGETMLEDRVGEGGWDGEKGIEGAGADVDAVESSTTGGSGGPETPPLVETMLAALGVQT